MELADSATSAPADEDPNFDAELLLISTTPAETARRGTGNLKRKSALAEVNAAPRETPTAQKLRVVKNWLSSALNRARRRLEHACRYVEVGHGGTGGGHRAAPRLPCSRSLTKKRTPIHQLQLLDRRGAVRLDRLRRCAHGRVSSRQLPPAVGQRTPRVQASREGGRVKRPP